MYVNHSNCIATDWQPVLLLFYFFYSTPWQLATGSRWVKLPVTYCSSYTGHRTLSFLTLWCISGHSASHWRINRSSHPLSAHSTTDKTFTHCPIKTALSQDLTSPTTPVTYAVCFSSLDLDVQEHNLAFWQFLCTAMLLNDCGCQDILGNTYSTLSLGRCIYLKSPCVDAHWQIAGFKWDFSDV